MGGINGFLCRKEHHATRASQAQANLPFGPRATGLLSSAQLEAVPRALRNQNPSYLPLVLSRGSPRDTPRKATPIANAIYRHPAPAR